MTTQQLRWPGGPLGGTAHLPASKSEANRALLLQRLAGGGTLTNLSEANDTVLMQRLLGQAAGTDLLDAQDAGTVMRFMTAYLAVTGWRGTLTGAARMKQRPIGILVDALRALGAAIEYVEKEGYPPLRFTGGGRAAGATAELAVRGDISSQYISALLMVAPMLPGGLRLRLTGEVGSRPYIKMTLKLMRHFGATATEVGRDEIEVQAGGYRPADYQVESDWSAASYWYALLALAPAGSSLVLPGLREKSWQGDHVIQIIMRPLGVATEFLADGSGARLTQVPPNPVPAHAPTINFTDCPDLAQTVAVVAAALGRPLRLTGLHSLRIKETDRIAAIQTELRKFGADMPEVEPGVFEVQSAGFKVDGQVVDTYDDHRMAMAFAPLAMRGPLAVHDPLVVRKSYPSFWRALAAVGMAE
ncbi:3-phosphoshikimate 1-carboxyvinyltransferase [Hymenobacter sp. UV11]|uniref:3-phosphoshikimate 1-carboxyvinyltransferase n=1 Tax=Hymenobacter sp. UV11 TaxID=1849735 RepID=UPI00105FC368|nr:3-phosphoshikimate 1-carboxyvinyltransferase [Hymenobacter sp. UV11]TDN37157.1 3-phosphoshikimate 1-carboxyvinyltransferase [Hymenobacter sp. UV11]TFZ67725.1 3-phosphoshikimate 1-carboxyvinyltransferase [Hymenobacter sp. UV11]